MNPTKSGFTLVEMLTVVALISILVGMTGVSLGHARRLARRARAETEIRETINAWLQYAQTFRAADGSVPGMPTGNDKVVTAELIAPLIDPNSNPLKIVLLNVSLAGRTFNDPWGTPYQLSFERNQLRNLPRTGIRTSVSFPNAARQSSQ